MSRPAHQARPGLALGLDFGTSGARCCVIDAREHVLFEARVDFPAPREQTPAHWAQALDALLDAIPALLRPHLARMALCATSGTVLLTDAALRPLGPALAYFDQRAAGLVPALRAAADGPGPLDALARLAWLWAQPGAGAAAHALHQADWIAARLLGRAPPADWHNALKTGADPARADWGAAAASQPFARLLPRLLAPGADLGRIHAAVARRHALPPRLRVRAGTTDANACFIASGARRPGQALTTLGSTLSIKLISPRRVDDPETGVYSHRWGQAWLAGGASNAGGAVLRRLFDDATLRALSARIDPERDSPLDLYPLPAPGERFPVHDPKMSPRLLPRPADDAAYLHGLLQALARIEAEGYALLARLGAGRPDDVLSAGGGAANPVWTRLRERALGVAVRMAPHSQAAFGAARLALHGRSACGGG